MTKNRLVWLVAATGTVLSLLTQYCVRATLCLKNPPETVPFLPGILHFTCVMSGAAFRLLNDVRTLVILISLGFILFLVTGTFFVSWLLSKSDKEIMKPLQVGVGLLLAGGISNTVERLLFNEVAVFIDFRLFQMEIFNLADVFVRLGNLTSVISVIFLGLQFGIRRWRR